MDTCIPMVHNV